MSLTVDIVKKLKDMTLNVSFSTENTWGTQGILGASGCGKSMALKCIAGIETPDRGRIVLNGRVLFDSEKKINIRIQDRRVGYLFQSYALFPHMTVLENVEAALWAGTGSHCDPSPDTAGRADCMGPVKAPVTAKHRREKAFGFLRMFHVDDLAGHYPSRLSGGQQQRVALARIMASKPDVLMLDEPFSALDAYLKESLQLELMEELQEYKGDVLLVTHNRDEIYRLCTTIHVLERGRLVISGDVKEVFQNPKTVSAARLTGCKNIVEIKRLDCHQCYVPKWNARLSIKIQEIPEACGYIGIRAHYLESAERGGGENTLPCHLNHLVEDPFEVTLILDNGIWWKIPKEVWNMEFHGQAPLWMTVPEKSILFLREDETEGTV